MQSNPHWKKNEIEDEWTWCDIDWKSTKATAGEVGNAWTRTQPVELGYNMVALGGLNAAYQFRASEFLTRHMDQQQNLTFWMQAAISRIHHDVRSPKWLQRGLQVWQWTRYRMVWLVQETSFGEPWLSNKKNAQLWKPSPSSSLPSASQTLECCPNSMETIWSEAARKGASPQGTCPGLNKFHPKSTDQSAQKYPKDITLHFNKSLFTFHWILKIDVSVPMASKAILWRKRGGKSAQS